jgi:hypothetical protein
MEAFHSLSHFSGGHLPTPAEQAALSQTLERFQASHHDLDCQAISRFELAAISSSLRRRSPNFSIRTPSLCRLGFFTLRLDQFRCYVPISSQTAQTIARQRTCKNTAPSHRHKSRGGVGTNITRCPGMLLGHFWVDRILAGCSDRNR